jgi:diguanylate cyclase (GGDEF)-like protein
MSDHAINGKIERRAQRSVETTDPYTLTQEAPELHWWGWLVLGVSIVALLACLLLSSYREAQHQATLDAGNLNQMLETRLNSTLHEVQTSLQSIAVHMDTTLSQGDRAPSVQPWQLRSFVQRYPAVGHFDVLAVDGSFLFDSDARPPVTTDGLERFRASLGQRVAGLDTTFMVLGSSTNKDLLYLAVPVVDEQQKPLGWIATSKPLTELVDVLSKLNVGTHGVITLRRTDQPQTILRIPSRKSYPRIYRPDGIDQLLAQGIEEGSLSMQSRVDGVERLYNFKRIGNLPVVSVIGLAAEDYLAGWKYTAIASTSVCAALYLLIIGLSLRLQTHSDRRQQMAEELRESAFQDELTGLPNRRYLLEHVNQAITDNSGRHLTLVYFDVDNFKTINDSLGHITGDAILRCLAQRLEALKPSVDKVARISGDEFLVLVDDGDPNRIAQLVNRILQFIQKPLVFDGYNLSVSISAGIACYPSHGHDFSSLLKAADTALTEAKRNGRNTWAFYETTMGVRELRFLHIQSELRQAFERKELQVFYQPQVDLATEEVVGAEALLRWDHPILGHIPPYEFIAVAEASGLIVPIGEWLVKEVCAQAIAWKEAGLSSLSVAMNCSAVQFRQGNLVQQVRWALYDSGLDPKLLELELTESILIEHSEHVIETMRGLKALGVRMSIDDFGTGYSSMSYLKRFAVDKLKIDQSFVRGMLTSSQDEAIVRAIITLGHSFGMTVIAEGVEEVDIRNALAAQGCNHAQGYLYAQALSATAFQGFVQDRIESSFRAQRWV